MKLYYAPGTCAVACWIALDWAGADYEVEKVDPASDTYQAINPLGTVPALDVGGTKPMTQNDAILHYVAERYPNGNLGPDDSLNGRFKFNETLSFLGGDFHPAFWPLFVPGRFTTETGNTALNAVRAAAQPRIGRVLKHLDDLIGDTGHVYGSRRTVADAYAFVMARWSTELPGGWRSYSRVAGFMNAMQADPAVSRVLDVSSQ